MRSVCELGTLLKLDHLCAHGLHLGVYGLDSQTDGSEPRSFTDRCVVHHGGAATHPLHANVRHSQALDE